MPHRHWNQGSLRKAQNRPLRDSPQSPEHSCSFGTRKGRGPRWRVGQGAHSRVAPHGARSSRSLRSAVCDASPRARSWGAGGRPGLGRRSEAVFTTEDDRLNSNGSECQEDTRQNQGSPLNAPFQTWSWGLPPASEAGAVVARQVAWTHGSWAWDTRELGWGCTGPGLTPAEGPSQRQKSGLDGGPGERGGPQHGAGWEDRWRDRGARRRGGTSWDGGGAATTESPGLGGLWVCALSGNRHALKQIQVSRRRCKNVSLQVYLAHVNFCDQVEGFGV